MRQKAHRRRRGPERIDHQQRARIISPARQHHTANSIDGHRDQVADPDRDEMLPLPGGQLSQRRARPTISSDGSSEKTMQAVVDTIASG